MNPMPTRRIVPGFGTDANFEDLEEVDEFTFEVFVAGLVGLRMFDTGYADFGISRWRKQIWAERVGTLDGNPLAMKVITEHRPVTDDNGVIQIPGIPTSVSYFIRRGKV